LEHLEIINVSSSAVFANFSISLVHIAQDLHVSNVIVGTEATYTLQPLAYWCPSLLKLSTFVRNKIQGVL